MKFFKSHFAYSKSQRNGVFVLILLVVLIQLLIHFYRFNHVQNNIENEVSQKIEQELDRLSKVKTAYVLKPFNPNYLSDYKAYQLGMSIAEIDRLYAFRKTSKYINSIAEFKQVTKVSDSLLSIISPYFKFPYWVTKAQKRKKEKRIKKDVLKDINKATFNDLIKIKGMSTKTANTILKYRNLLQGFSFKHQLNDVWGISQNTLKQLKQQFRITTQPVITKINVNTATAYELSRVVYINYKQAKSIVNYREEVAEIQNLAELKTITNFPVDNFDLISLYLQVQQNN